MKLPLVFGVVIAVVLVGAGIFVPLWRAAAAAPARAAAEQAELARRLGHRHDPSLNRLASLAELEGLKPADQQAFKSVIQRNADLLKQADQQSAQALSAGREVVGVPHVSGTIDFTRAAGLLAEAELLREAQRSVQAQFVRLVSRWKQCDAVQQSGAALEVDEVVDQLAGELSGLRQQADDARTAAGELAAKLAQAEAELAAVKDELKKTNDELVALEQRGFVAGDEGAFQAYRSQYIALANRVRAIEEREQLLQHGGLEGALFQDDDLLTAEIEGGVGVVGIETLRVQLAGAEEKAEHLGTAVAAVERQIEDFRVADAAAGQASDRYATLREELAQQQDELLARITELADQAFEQETQALRAATDAISGFKASQQAVNRWVSDTRTLQTEADPERLNPRLALVVGDRFLPQVGETAEAGAALLVGRIQALRMEALTALLNDMQIAAEARPDLAFDAAPYQEQAATAREEGAAKVTDALKKYETAVGRMPEESKWVVNAALAGANALLARFDADQAPALMQAARDSIAKAVRGAEQNPYLAEHVVFHRFLESNAPEKTPGDEKPEGEADTEAEP